MAKIDRHGSGSAKTVDRVRGRTARALLMASSVWTTGCVSVQPHAMDAQAAPQLDGRSVTCVTRAKPSFSALTPAKATFAVVGAQASVSEGNSLVESNAIPDPAVDMSLGLARRLERTHHMTLVAPGIPAATDDAGPIAAAARSRAQYVLDVRTINWSVVYFPTHWTHHRMMTPRGPG